MKYELTRHVHEPSGESYISFRHKSGVKVLVSPNGYTSACAVYSSDFGGADMRFSVDGKVVETPAGVAHFLEHKLFETEDGGDAFRLFSELGADSNAFTSHTSTSFTFSSPMDVFYESLSILLHFVHTPHFSRESVERERGIIAEELNMYEDDPDSRSFNELMKCMYRKNGVRYDVGGTVESIGMITPELLYLCHTAFYRPENMTLVIAGDADPGRIAGIMDEQIPEGRYPSVIKLPPEEPEKVCRRLSRIQMDISEPLFSFGIKDSPSSDPAGMRRRGAALSILCSMLFGASSAFYCDCYEKGLISGDTNAYYNYGGDTAYLTVTGESRRPFTVKKRIIKVIEDALKNGVDESQFERTKKVFYANFIYSLQSSSSVAYSLLSFELLHDDMLAYPDLLSSLDCASALGYLRSLYSKDRCAFTVAEQFKEE